MIEFKVTGLEGIDAALEQLKLSQRRTAARNVLKAALEPVVETAKRYAPVEEGTLRDSITVGTNVTKAIRHLRVKDGVTVFAGTANRNGVPREFGTIRSAAHPFLRPAWDANKGRVLDSILDNFGAEVRAAIDRAAKRNSRRR